MFGLALIAGVVWFVIWAVRQSGGGHHHAAGPQQPGAMPQQPVAPNDGHQEAVAIAKRRLASGEISKEQYEEIMRTLGG